MCKYIFLALVTEGIVHDVYKVVPRSSFGVSLRTHVFGLCRPICDGEFFFNLPNFLWTFI